MILADTDVLIDYLAGVQPAVDRIATYAAADQVQTSAINCFELMSGATKDRRGERIRQFLALLPVLPFDRTAAERAAEIRRDLEATGRPIGMGDSLIAGIALANNLALLTRNRTHFERVKDLRLADFG